jgi:Predicted integral membrane protein
MATSNSEDRGVVADGTSRAGGRPRIGMYVEKGRVAALYDGVVAIAATILVLQVRISASGEELSLSDINDSVHLILHWLVSFLMIAVLWSEFHFVFTHSRRWDGFLLAVTFAHVAAISLIPFASAVVGDHPDSLVASLVFASVMIANGLILMVITVSLRTKTHLQVAAQSDAHLALRNRTQLYGFSGAALISVLGAYLHHPLWGILGWALCPVELSIVSRSGARRSEVNHGG